MVTWVGLRNQMGPTRTLPLAIAAGLVITQFLAHGMTSPLRRMTDAARAMAKGDYSQRVVATSHDEVGELARAFNTMSQDLAHADMLRREMIANVSHELRTPVAALQAELENMVDGVTEPDPERLQVLLAQTERLGRLVTDILDLSRLEADVVQLDFEEVRVMDFLDSAVTAAKLVASGKGKQITFTMEVAPANLTMTVDSERLHQVTANLLANAIRYSPQGGVIALKAVVTGRWIQIDVTDQGPGIPPEDRERVFERFQRGKTGKSAQALSSGGTGLGLAIARWAVRLHAGTIGVADTEVGCTMRVRIPKSLPTKQGVQQRLLG
jgi:signal transduction histidine kinase